MANNNTVSLIGNTGKDAQVIKTENTTFATVSIATTDSYKDDDGNWHELETIWHDVIAFSPAVIEILENLKKGARIEVTGSLSYRPYKVMVEGKEITKKEVSIIARRVEQAPLVKKS